ncbi:MAG: VWA domain-containing protein [Candidatus Methanoperedens sp.]|nr:VWA domain-containing protein [Candidatus Methanoperedens sp.]MCZ7369925.1 VWA domain-containing protein [Candidatus Methanoperedens sp.]
MEFPQLTNPLMLLLISPVVLAGWYAIRKGIPRLLIISRIIILSLLIIALASPFTLGISTIRDEAPRITLVSDQTLSMDLFNKDTGQKLFEAIKSKTPTTYKQFAGIKSPIGDEVIQDAEGNNNIVLVSDGNNNYGKDLFDAISFVSKTGTKVFAVRQTPIHNDASVEIASAKNLIIGNENTFNIVVRQAGNETTYRLDVQIDGTPVKSDTITQSERTQVIPVSYTFNSLGSHKVTATITPSGEDWNPLNNVFYRSVFVVPKPQVLAVTDDKTSPLYTVASSLYQVTTSGDVPDDLSAYKAVIIDNKGAAQLSADSLRKYVGSGGGLVVVGGDASYDKGNYNNSPVEAMLPIISRAAEYKGGRNIVIIIDSSSSTIEGGSATTIFGNAINIINDKKLVDANLGVVIFGKSVKTFDMRHLINQQDKQNLIDDIKKQVESGLNIGDETALDTALFAARDMLSKFPGQNQIILLSDGGLQEQGRFAQILDAAKEVHTSGITIIAVHVVGTPASWQYNINNVKYSNVAYDGLAFMEILAKETGGDYYPIEVQQKVNINYEEQPSITPTPTTTPEISHQYPLVAIDTNHFITKYINLTASVTGYNDVTPKLGSDGLVATIQGKPILTTWGFGLGRVASFTTDNGNPSDSDPSRPWASQVYSGENSRLISAMINWAIGDPRPKEGVVIQAEDIWGGTSGKIVVTSKTPPIVKLDGKTDINLASTGPSTFEYSLNFDRDEDRGFHDLSGYGIAVNYPLEYRDVGFNDQLTSVINANGGRVYDESEVEGLLLLDIKEKAVRTVQEPMSQKEPFLLAALVLFLGEVIVRRLKDYRKERPVIQDNPPRAVAPAEQVIQQAPE